MRIVGVGGSTREGSSTERLIRAVLDAAAEHGAETRLFSGPSLILPPYEPRRPLPRRARTLVEAVRGADALVFGSPGYHGTLSGLVKNALDYLEELAGDERPYVDGLPVACVVTASGWQAAVNTLRGLRETVHALRGWPTPMGLAVNVADGLVDAEGRFRDPRLADQVRGVADQLVTFARTAEAARTPALGPGGGSAVALVAEQVRRAVAVGRFGPGDRLPATREIADQLGVTVETARRGLDELVAEAVVEPVGDRGGRVAVAAGARADMPPGSDASLAEFDEILDFRLAAECTTARLAAERRDEGQLAALREALAALSTARSGRGPAGYVRFHRADADFHAAIARASGNTLLARAVADAHARMFLPVGAVFARLADSADELHGAIVEAIAEGDADAAEGAMRAHVESTRADVKAMLGAPRSRAVLA